MLRDNAENMYVLLKQDLTLSTHCKNAREAFLSLLKNKNLFLDSITAEFISNPPYKISENDAPQIAMLKKVVNGLDSAEKTFLQIENTDMGSDRYTLGIFKDLIPTAYKGVQTIYEVFNNLNQCTQEAQLILSPYISTVLSKAGEATEKLNQLSSSSNKAAFTLGNVVQLLPKTPEIGIQGTDRLAQLITDLPHYFEELQSFIDLGQSGIEPQNNTSLPEYQAKMQARAQKLKANFEASAVKSGWSVISSYFSTGSVLINHTADLINAGAPLTKQAYKDAVVKLNEIRHLYLPKLIAEMEAIEESLGLQPGVLTEPFIANAESYYGKLADHVNQMASAVGILDGMVDKRIIKWARYLLTDNTPIDTGEKLQAEKNLNVLRDPEFLAQVRSQRASRLLEHEVNKKNDLELTAARKFFQLLAVYKPYGTDIRTQKQALLDEYKIFQSSFAALYPKLDKDWVQYLNTEKAKISFSETLGFEKEILTKLAQKQGQAAFLAETLSKAEEIREQTYYAKNNNTSLASDVSLYVPLSFIKEEKKPFAYYLEKQHLFLSEIRKIRQAKKGLEAFFELLKKDKNNSNPEIRSFSANDKELLRKALNQFQPHLVSFDKALHDRLVRILSSSTSIDTLAQNDLLRAQVSIQTALAEHLNHYTQQEEIFRKAAQEAKKVELQALPLQNAKGGIENQSLLGKVYELKLSKKVDSFFQNQLMPLLKTRLLPEVLSELEFNYKKLPAGNFYMITKDAESWQRLINAVFYIKQGLESLESAKELENSSSTITRGRYVYNFIDIIPKVLFAIGELKEVSKQPAAAATVNEVLETVRPLQTLPVVGTYIQSFYSSNSVELPLFDVKKVWLEQQKIRKEALKPNSASKSKETDAKLQPVLADLPPKENAPSLTMDRVLEQLYLLPQTLENLKDKPQAGDLNALKKSANKLATSLRGLSYGPWSLKTLMQSVNELNTVISNSAVKTRELILDQVGTLRDSMAAQIASITDAAECSLGFKPGSLSNEVFTQFDEFYKTLINNLPFSQDQQLLKILMSTRPTEIRLEKERERLEATKKDQKHEEIAVVIFGKPDKEMGNINEIMRALVLVHEMDDNFINAKKDSIIAIYKKLLPYLEKYLPSKFSSEFINKNMNASQIKTAMKALIDVQDSLGEVNVLYQKFKSIDETFGRHMSEIEDESRGIERSSETFKKIKTDLAAWYKEILPHMAKTDWASKFPPDLIEKAKTADELKKAVNDIKVMKDYLNSGRSVLARLMRLHQESNLNPDLFGNVQAENNPKRDEFLELYAQLQPHLYQINNKYDQIYYLRQKLGDAAGFKAELANMFSGSFMDRALNDMSQIVGGLFGMVPSVGRSGDLQRELEKYVLLKSRAWQHEQTKSQERIKLLEKQLETEKASADLKLQTFKENILKRHIELNVLNQFDADLGSFAKFFLARILPGLDAKKNLFIADVTLNDDIEKTIVTRVENTILSLTKDQQRFFNIYLELNAIAKNLTAKISLLTKKSDKNNPLTQETLQYLNKEMDDLLKLDGEQITIQELNECKSRGQKAIKKAELYDVLSKTQQSIVEMKTHILQLSDHEKPHNQLKLAELDEMLTILADKQKNPNSRMVMVVNKGLGDSFSSVMSKNADGFILRCLKAFVSMLGLWQDTQKTQVKEFKSLLNTATKLDKSGSEKSPVENLNNPGSSST